MPERRKVVVIGGSISGLTMARALHGRGHDITVLERDPQAPPATVEQAHSGWPRATVPQSVHSHAFASLGMNLLKERDPVSHRALLAAGATEIRLRPPSDPAAEDADPVVVLACRRSTFELVYRQAVLGQTGIAVRHGARARGLRLDGRRVTGVVMDTGEGRPVTLDADLVIDASGRRSTTAAWLREAGVEVPPDQVVPAELTCYSRFYRQLAQEYPGPLERGGGSGDVWASHSGGLYLGDNRTFSISVCVLPTDQALKAVRTPEAFTAAVRATPLLRPWIEPGVSEPISGVSAMGSLDNALRGLALDPPVDGLFAIGDAACTTNPLYGRGTALALSHAYRLADLLAAHPAIGPQQTAAAGRLARELFTPWYEDAVAHDRRRAAVWKASLNGTPPPQPSAPDRITLLKRAAANDPVVWRQLMRVTVTLDTPDTLQTDEIRERVEKAARAAAQVPVPRGPSRDELVDALNSVAAAAV